MKLKGRDFLTLKDFTAEEIGKLLELSEKLKKDKKLGIKNRYLEGKNIALIFEKPSTRTRCAFTVACNDTGAYSEYLGRNDIQLGHKESIEDTARVLSSMFDGIEFRGFSHKNVEKLAEYSKVPVWNGLTDEYHPTQALADLLTIKEHFGYLQGLNVTYIGDGRNNVAISLMIGCLKMGINFKIIAPKELHPSQEIIEICAEYVKEKNSNLLITEDVEEIKNTDVVYTDVWCSMGEEEKLATRMKLLKPYQVNIELMKKIENEDVIVMHCLPAVKGNEITEEVFEKYANTIFEETENRMHTIKAVMVATLSDIEL